MDRAVQLAATSQLNRTEAVLDYVRMIAVDDFASELPRQAAGVLGRAVQEFQKGLSELVDDLEPLTPSDALISLGQFGVALEIVSQLSSVVRASAGWSSNPHWERPLERLVVAGAGARILLHPLDSLNYTSWSLHYALNQAPAGSGRSA